MKLILLSIFCLCIFSVNAQFWGRVMPASVHAGSTQDTLLNTRQVLLKAGVKEIHVSNSNPEITKTFATKKSLVNNEGRVTQTTICFQKNQSTGFTFCVFDTIAYEPNGHMISMRTTDNAKNIPIIVERSAEENETGYVIHSGADSTSFTNEVYNTKGQLIHYTDKTQSVKYNTRYYYNEDGLLDSMVHEGSETYIFKRTDKRSNKIIKLQTLPGNRLTWEYNPSGQCISYTSFIKYRPGLVFADGSKKDHKTVIRYFYNDDGTLLKVANKSSNQPSFTLSYSYIK